MDKYLELALQGKTIEAVKQYMKDKSVGLKEAKRIVEKSVDDHYAKMEK